MIINIFEKIFWNKNLFIWKFKCHWIRIWRLVLFQQIFRKEKMKLSQTVNLFSWNSTICSYSHWEMDNLIVIWHHFYKLCKKYPIKYVNKGWLLKWQKIGHHSFEIDIWNIGRKRGRHSLEVLTDSTKGCKGANK